MEHLTKYFLLFSWVAVSLFEIYLLLRQLARLWSSKMKSAIQPQNVTLYNQKVFDRRFRQLHWSSASFLFEITLILFELVPWLWKGSERFLGYLGLDMGNGYLHSLLLLGVLKILDLTFYTYTIMIDDNQQKVRSFLTHTKERFQSWLCEALAIAVIVSLKRVETPYPALYLWPFFFFSSNLRPAIKNLFPQHAFDTLIPLQDGELKMKIACLASANRFPLDKILVVAGPKFKDSHTYVYKCGILRKSILIDERLINQFPSTDEAAAMVAHEIGHWKFNHHLYEVAFKVVEPLVFLGIFDFVAHSSDLYLSFGFRERSAAVAFYLINYAKVPTDCFFHFAKNTIFRKGEYKVDAFTRQQGYGQALEECIVEFSVTNLPVKDKFTDPWFSAYWFSRPCFMERLCALYGLDMETD